MGLVNHFNKLINQWHPELKGILAGFGRLQLKKPTANMLNEEAELHLDVQSDFWMFRPLIGRQLKGVVSKRSQTHVSCLVHGVFNVPCYRPRNPRVVEWWGENVRLKQTVRLTVVKTDMSQRVPFIQGDLQNIGIDGSEPETVHFDQTVPSPQVEEYSEPEWDEMVQNKTDNGKKSKVRQLQIFIYTQFDLIRDSVS